MHPFFDPCSGDRVLGIGYSVMKIPIFNSDVDQLHYLPFVYRKGVADPLGTGNLLHRCVHIVLKKKFLLFW